MIRESKTKTAINTGGAMMHKHPEYYFGGPYGVPPFQDRDLMMYGHPMTRGVRGGCGVCRRRSQMLRDQLYGKGIVGGSFFSELAETLLTNLSGEAGDALKLMAQKLNTSIIGLLKKPDVLFNVLKEYYPKIVGTVQKIIKWFKDKWHKIHPKKDKPKSKPKPKKEPEVVEQQIDPIQPQPMMPTENTNTINSNDNVAGVQSLGFGYNFNDDIFGFKRNVDPLRFRLANPRERRLQLLGRMHWANLKNIPPPISF